jgi:ABC-type xylose transport system permease subunit
MQIVNNSLVLLDINPSWTQVITGSILVLSIAIDKASRMKKSAR